MNNVDTRERAKRDIEEIFVFIGERDFDAGLDFLLAVEQTCELLATMPRLGSTRRFSSARTRGIRQFPVKSYEDYLIFYVPSADGIDVLRVLHGKRDIESILKNPF